MFGWHLLAVQGQGFDGRVAAIDGKKPFNHLPMEDSSKSPEAEAFPVYTLHIGRQIPHTLGIVSEHQLELCLLLDGSPHKASSCFFFPLPGSISVKLESPYDKAAKQSAKRFVCQEIFGQKILPSMLARLIQ